CIDARREPGIFSYPHIIKRNRVLSHALVSNSCAMFCQTHLASGIILPGCFTFEQHDRKEDRVSVEMRPVITDEHTTFFRENGYLVVHGALTQAEVEELRQATIQLCRDHADQIRGAMPAAPDQSDDEILQRYLCIHF